MNNGKHKNTELCFLVENDMTFVLMATNLRTQSWRGSSHPWVLGQKLKTMIERGSVTFRLTSAERLQAKDKDV